MNQQDLMQILDRVARGEITPEEGNRLITGLGAAEGNPPEPLEPQAPPQPQQTLERLPDAARICCA